MESDLKRLLRRHPRPTERAAFWLVAFVLGCAGAASVLGAIGSGATFPGEESFAGIVRGYTGPGLLFGGVALLLSGVSFLYVLRKRALQESALAKASMMTWLWVHSLCGALAYLAAGVHAGAGLVDRRLTAGDVAFWGATLVTVSGIAWRIVYQVLPRGLVELIGNYSTVTSETRVAEQRVEAEKLAAGGSARLHEAKEWLLAADRTAVPVALESAAAQLIEAERAVFARLVNVSASLHRAAKRRELQESATQRLQGWRQLHVPLSLLVGLAVVLHVGAVYRMPSRVMGLWLSPEQLERTPLLSTNHHLSQACSDCHKEIYDQWITSMHAHAQSSPVTVAQANQVARSVLAGAGGPDPARICVQCHSPVGSLLSSGNILPLGASDLQRQGVGCTTCHQFAGKPASASGGVSDGMMAQIEPGPVMLGRSASNVGNAYHSTRPSPTLSRDPTDLCQNCHNVHVDRDGSGDIDRGLDLVLQMTHQEYTRYRSAGGSATCMDCHMPVVEVQGRMLERSAETARIPFEQDMAAPRRVIRSHRFVGVDYPLNEAGANEPNMVIRHALLRSAASLQLDSVARSVTAEGKGELSVAVSITNVGAGHDLPTGFAFARQMWLEVIVRGEAGEVLFSSGQVDSATSDLCDENTLGDANAALRAHVQGCQASDPQLVNFQKKLVDKTVPLRDGGGALMANASGDHVAVQAADGTEVTLQHLTGGAVLRTRPADGALMAPLRPRETGRFSYAAGVPASGAVEVSVRLLFRHLPPYFLRQLAADQPANEEPELAPLIQHLEIVEMASVRRTLE